MVGCSRGGLVEDDSKIDLALPADRRDLAGADLGAPTDLGSTVACPAPCWLNPQPQGNNLMSVWREPGGDGWAVGFGPSLVRLEKGSARLVRTAAGLRSSYFLGLWGSSASDVWAVGTNIVLHYDGKDWTQAPIDTGGFLGLTAVWGSGPKDIWAVGWSGAIRHYDGSGWQAVASGVTANLKSVHGTGDKSAFAVGESGSLLRWDGSAWRSTSGLTISTLNRVRCAAAIGCRRGSGPCRVLPATGRAAASGTARALSASCAPTTGAARTPTSGSAVLRGPLDRGASRCRRSAAAGSGRR